MSFLGVSSHRGTPQQSSRSKHGPGGREEGGKEDQLSAALSVFFASPETPPHSTACLWGQWVLLYTLLKGSEKLKTSKFNIGPQEF